MSLATKEYIKSGTDDADKALARYRAIVEPMPWDRIKGETDKTYEYFQYFVAMGVGRTLNKVWQDFGKGERFIKKISSERRWRERAQAWDLHVQREKEQAIIDAQRNMVARQASIGMDMQALAVERMQQIARDPLLQAEMGVGDVVRLADAGVKIERLARGETTGEERSLTFVLPGGMPKWAPQHTPTKTLEAAPEDDPYREVGMNAITTP